MRKHSENATDTPYSCPRSCPAADRLELPRQFTNSSRERK